jgi:hypothetical protein
MSTAENIHIVSRYNWKDLPTGTIKDYAITVFKESHRLPDRWRYLIKERGLFDINRNGYVRDIVKQFPHPNVYLREVEDKIIEDMNKWALNGKENSIIWISPWYKGGYDGHKIEILIKSKAFKGTRNFSIQFDCDDNTCLRLIGQLFPEMKNVQHLEDIRSKTITKNNIGISEILKVVGPYIPKSDKVKHIPAKHFEYIADLAHSGVDQQYVAYEMQRLGIIGEHSYSCTGSSSGLVNILGESSLNISGMKDQFGPLEFECPACHKINKRPFGRLLNHCQRCGASVRC